MNTQTTNTYLLTALEAYPYELTKAVEALNYALSYEPDNAHALALMGQIHHEQLQDYEQAKLYYEAALASRLDLPEIYRKYILLLLHADDFIEAQRVIDYAHTVKGIDKASLYMSQGQLYENLEQFDKAEIAFKEAKYAALNNGFIEYIDNELTRIKAKKQTKFNKNKIQEGQINVQEKPSTTKSWFQNRLNNLL